MLTGEGAARTTVGLKSQTTLRPMKWCDEAVARMADGASKLLIQMFQPEAGHTREVSTARASSTSSPCRMPTSGPRVFSPSRRIGDCTSTLRASSSSTQCEDCGLVLCRLCDAVVPDDPTRATHRRYPLGHVAWEVSGSPSLVARTHRCAPAG